MSEGKKESCPKSSEEDDLAPSIVIMDKPKDNQQSMSKPYNIKTAQETSASLIRMVSMITVLPHLERTPRLIRLPELYDHLLRDLCNSAPSLRTTSYHGYL